MTKGITSREYQWTIKEVRGLVHEVRERLEQKDGPKTFEVIYTEGQGWSSH